MRLSQEKLSTFALPEATAAGLRAMEYERGAICRAVEAALRPALDRLSPPPAGGWLACAYAELCHGLFPDPAHTALPEQVLDVFPGSRPTGIKHGTVTVVIGSRSAEVTTFRSEGDYTDHRHPSSVAFVGDLTTDLMRRDFTMNAMAVSADGLIIDP